MTATITDVEERTDYTVLRHPRVLLTVRYETDAGTHGSVEIPKEGATPESILAAVRSDTERVHSVVGMSTE